MAYDETSAKIKIMLGTVYDTADGMKASLDKIENAWSDCMTAWNDLKMSWVGKTKEEVEAFQLEIEKVQNMIFGSSKDDPNKGGDELILDKPGLYQQVRGVAMGGTQNYYHTDQSVAAMFTQTRANIDGTTYTIPGVDADGNKIEVAPQSGGAVENMTDPPITETFA